ncbi:MAG: SCP2 sterol-binding domain-containing protein [Proteobacteria bacterium]|nr:SCP2 sterol-binding domain-containing protein [Pseudomonadota bacterium]
MTTIPRSVYMGAPADIGIGPRGEVAHRAYSEHGRQFERKVHAVAPGVWCHVGACLGNSTAIEGRRGLIVVDTGDCIEQARMHQEDFGRVCDKPLSSLLYTHSHYIFGSRAWVPAGHEDQVEVWAHPDLMRNMLRMVGDLSPTFIRRAAIQFGMFLPREGEDAMSHQGLGPFVFEFDKYQPTTGFVRPNRTTTDGRTVEIDGVRMQFFHTWGDTDDTLLISLPETGTVINNIAWPAMFNIYTLRGDVFRNPVELLRGLDRIIELAPEHLVGVHGVPLHGREAIRQAVTEYRDTIQFTYDQTVRGINAGLSPDELVDFVRLPEALARGRLTGQFYGELPFHVRQIYAGLVGWFGKDTTELHRPSPAEQATRTIALAGGPARVADAVRDALDRREYAWAAQMAGWLLDGGFDDESNRRLKARALRSMGQATTAANTRSWYLTQARELEGKVDTRIPPIRFVNAGMVRQMPPATYVNGLRFQLPPQLSADGPRRIVLNFSDPDVAFTLQLRHGVVQIAQGAGAADAVLTIPFDAWARLVGREAKAQALVDAGEIRIEGDAALAGAVLRVGG